MAEGGARADGKAEREVGSRDRRFWETSAMRQKMRMAFRMAFSTAATAAGAAVMGSVAMCAAAEVGISSEAELPLHGNRDAYTPAAAFGEGVFLVAWQSGRNGPGDLRKGLNLIGDIVACRVDKSGKVLDAEPAVICGAADQQEDVRVAFGGGVFLLVWQDIRNGKDWDVYAARVAPDGKVFDKDGLLVAGGPHNQAKPRVVWDGKTFLVVWQDFRSGRSYEIYAARVSADGKVAGPGGVKVASGDFYHCVLPAAASAGGGRSFIVNVAQGAAADGYRAPLVQGWFVEDGKPEAKPVYIANDKGNRRKDEDCKHGPDSRGDPLAMAAGGGSYLLLWKNDSSLGRGFGPEGNAAMFDEKGSRTQNLYFSGGKGKRDRGRICNPSVAWDGSAFVASWHEFVAEKNCPSDVVFVQRVGADGNNKGEAEKVAGSFASPASSPAVASDGSGTSLIAYEKHPDRPDVPIKIAFRLLRAAR